MDVPARADGQRPRNREPAEADDKKKEEVRRHAQTREEMTSAASEILRKIMRRPK